MTDIFISYSRKDQEFARRLFDSLAKEELDAWVDWEGIPPTADWLQEIYKGIEASNTFVFVISPDSLTSEICGIELEYAIKLNKRLIPIVCRDPKGHEMVKQLSAHNWIFIKDDNFDAGVQTVLDAMSLDLGYVRAHTRILTRALEWERFDRVADYVLRGSDLKDAEVWLADETEEVSPKPTALQRKYVIASRQQAAKQQRRLLFGVVAALIISVGLGFLAFTQWQLAGTERDRAIDESEQRATQEAIAIDESYQRATQEAIAVKAQGVAEEALATQVAQAVQIEEQVRLARSQALGANSLNLASTDSQLALLLALYGAQETLEDGIMQPEVREALYVGIDTNFLANLARSDTDLRAHEDAVFAVTFHPDGDTAYTGGLDGMIRGWDLETGDEIFSLLDAGIDYYPEVTVYDIADLAISPDGRYLASAANTRSLESHISLWELETMERVMFYIYRPVEAVNPSMVQFSPDGSILAMGFSDGITQLYDLEAKRVMLTFAGNAEVHAIAFDSDSSLIAIGYHNGKIVIWDASTGESVSTISAHSPGTYPDQAVMYADTRYPGGVTGLAFSPDATKLVSAGRNPGAAMWDVATGNQIGVLEGHVGQVNDVSFTQNGNLIGTIGEDGNAILWDVDTLEVVRIYDAFFNDGFALAFNYDGSEFLVGGQEGKVQLWQAINKTRLLYQLEDPHEIFYDAESFTGSKFSHIDLNWDGSELLSVVRTSPTSDVSTLLNALSLFDLTDGSMVQTGLSGMNAKYLGETGEFVRNSPVQSAFFLTDPIGGTESVLLDTVAEGAQHWMISADGQFLSYSPRRLVFSTDDHKIVYVIKIETSEIVAEFPGYWGSGSLSPNGQYILLDGKIIEVESGEEVADLGGWATWSEDGEYLVGISGSSTILIWDANTYELLHTLVGHLGQVTDTAFIPEKQTLVSVGEDSFIKFWDLERGEIFREIDDPSKVIVDIEISGDGNTMAVAQEDGKIFVYSLNADDLITQALERLIRDDLTQAECQRYLGLEECALQWLDE